MAQVNRKYCKFLHSHAPGQSGSVSRVAVEKSGNRLVGKHL
jgi:hypothetical protein